MMSQKSEYNSRRSRARGRRQQPAAPLPLTIVTTTTTTRVSTSPLLPSGTTTHCTTAATTNAAIHSSSNKRLKQQNPQATRQVMGASYSSGNNNASTSKATAAAPIQQQQQQQQQQSYLVNLSESCKKHAATAHAGNSRGQHSLTGGGGGGGCCLDLRDADKYCRDALDLLRRILPKVEEKVTSALDVSHMCDFYDDAVAGGFCPHAPHLFLDPVEILPRVHFLFQHLASQDVIHASTGTPQQQQQPSVATKICHTAAQLLSAVPNSNLLASVLRDLIYLAKDLAVLSESGLLLLAGKVKNNKTGVVAAEVVLFEETVESCDWSTNVRPEFTVRIRDDEALLSLQGAVLVILERFVTIRKERRLQQQEADAVAIVLEELDESYLTAGGFDLYYFAVEPVDVRSLLMALKQAVLCSPTRTRGLGLRLQQAAVRVLLSLQADCHRTGVQCLAMMQEVALLIARATVEYAKAPSATDPIMATDLAKLVSTLIHVPPVVQGSMTQSAVATAIHRATFAVVCESVRYMKCGGRSADGVDIKHDCWRPLAIVLLRTIHAMIYCLRNGGDESDLLCTAFALPSMFSRDLCGHLFRLLGDRDLSDSAVWILSHLLYPVNAPLSRLADIDGVAKFCMSACQQESQAPEDDDLRSGDAGIPEYGGSSFPAGSKRKLSSSHCARPGESIALSSLSVYTAALNKRRKIGAEWTNDSTLCTFDDELSIFLGVALCSASSLRELLRREESTGFESFSDPKLADSILFDLMNVSSAVRLFLAAAKNKRAPRSFFSATVSPSVSRVTEYFLETITAVNGALLSTCKSNGEKSLHVRSLGDAAVACGILVELSICLLAAESSKEAVYSKAVSCSKSSLVLAKHLHFLPVCCRPSSNRSSGLPEALHETLYGFSLRRQAGVSTGQPKLICIFEVMQFSVMMDTKNNGFLSVLWTGPALDAVNGDNQSQINRLEFLSKRSGQAWAPVSNWAELEKQSFDASKLVDKAHPDPLVRLFMWQSLAWSFVSVDPQDLRLWLRRENPTGSKSDPDYLVGSRLVHFLIDVAFSDPDPVVRDYSSRELGGTLSVNSWAGLLALLSKEEEWQQLRGVGTCLASVTGARRAAEQIASRLFQHVDCILHKQCSVPQSQLSFTVTSAPMHAASAKQGISPDAVVSFRRSAARALCSLCGDAPVYTNFRRIVVEHAIIRVVRMWSGIDACQRFEGAGICFAELTRLSHCSQIGSLLRGKYLATFTPALFRDVLVPSSSLLVGTPNEGIERMTLGLRERQFDLLSTFVRAVFLETRPTNGISDFPWNGELDLEICLDLCLPFVISQLVVEKDYGALQLTAGYKLYLLGQKRSEYKHRKRSGTSYLESEPATGVVVGEVARSSSSRQWSRNLEDQTRQLCLAPGLIEQIIPQVFMRAGREELIFFTKTVLQNKVTLKQLVTSREMLTLKNFVIELGRNPEMAGLVVRAMKTAAIARNQDSVGTSRIRASGENGIADDAAVTAWVTSHFMFLLVNVAQYKWSTKSNDHRVEALRSLVSALDFLLPSESSQYLPQIMATVNAALVDEPDDTDKSIDPTPRLQLRLLAVQVLSKFVKLVAQTQWEILGHNLTSIVVSVVPILSDGEGVQSTQSVEKECRGDAVALLEWLTRGDLGAKLSPYFSEIPFLPPSSALDSVRASLRSRGVNFDNLHVVTTQGTQDGLSRSATSDAGSTSGDSRGAASSAVRQAALRRRLEIVCPLLENESASVRRVVLHHLTALLRANRELFHALVENEGATSMKQFVTVAYRGKTGFPRWTITEILDVLLSRCVYESDPEARILLGTCFGEVGAIGAHRLEDAKASSAGPGCYARRSSDPPWHSTPHRYELQLITTHLVVALKAAPTSSDQHKIAFTIQQVLALLNEAGKEGLLSSPSEGSSQKNTPSRQPETRPHLTGNDRTGGFLSKQEMEESLVRKLVDARVLDVVEPFWFSEFHEAEQNKPKEPPFFRSSSSFYGWLSNWCRYMVHRAHDTRKNDWTKLFFACRTALRTEAGLGVAEFLLPILILDRLCYGNGNDQNMILTEIRDVLTFDSIGTIHAQSMSHTDRRKAVSAIFSVLDLLQYWVEPEIESRYVKKARSPRADHINLLSPATPSSCSDWLHYESAMRIEDMVGKVPLSLRAKAAACVGMHASALRFLEMASRSAVVGLVFGKDSIDAVSRSQNRSLAAGSCPKEAVSLMKDVLASLNDYETMSALGDDDVWASPRTRVRDSIRQKEALRDWQGALHDYERAQQLNLHDPTLRFGVLRCLLELGHFESVLQQVSCRSREPNVYQTSIVQASIDAVPLAVEASWRLGRWETLSKLVESGSTHASEPDALYQTFLGKTMLDVQKKNLPGVLASLRNARCAVMDGLASVARESYSRAYDHVVRLQALREIEDVSSILCSHESTPLGELAEDTTFGWNRRLDLVSSSGATTIINARLALARLAGDAAFEGSLFLRMGKRGRKSGLHSAAANSFAQAEAAFSSIESDKKAILKSSLQLQFAKLKHDCGESSIALRMLGQEDMETMGKLDDDELVARSFRRVIDNLGIEKHGMDEKMIMDVFVRSALQSTRWMIEGGLKGGAEVIARFRIIHRVAPTFEKGHFQFAKYIDSLLQSRIMALQGRSSDHLIGSDDDGQRCHTISRDRTLMRYVVLAVMHYAETVVLDVKHVYQALPRLLSLWFDFTAIKDDVTADRPRSLSASRIAEAGHLAKFLLKSQDETNAFMATTFKRISAQALYTAMPQLISRITHEDNDTASVVQAILRRVLTKYPAQAMWPLAWVRQSRDPQRQRIGVDIFYQAVEALNKSESLHKLLVTSKTLIDYLYALAKHEVSEKVKDAMKIRPLSNEVDLSEFVPPIQAALSASLVSGDSSRSRDVFPRHIPRMRAFDEIVGVMNSKARPKKLKAYVVAADSMPRLRTCSNGTKDYDIGEMHFLVKQEAKGDLRKDARVQDLNNVINRIMSSTDDAKGLSAQRRRLHLRTFSVTCLSEETGLLEWVPHTAAIRSLITKTYNPQADAIHGKRQGKRITHFNDPQMRIKFEKKCQDTYFISGNLTRAAALFESELLKSYPPVLYWWFVQQFPDPHAWYEARTRFILSSAVWSAVGHVIGLGDRHSENILLDKTTGECVHVDFDCIFDKGLHLPKPEVVPFRLTQNMVDAFGPTGADGVYTCNLKSAMGTLRDNRDTLLSVLEPFVKDPVINWKRYKSQQRGNTKSTDQDPTVEAKQKMSVIDERLRGIYNLRNPNSKKIRRTDRLESQEDDDLSHPIPLSVEGQVHRLIAEATSNENLVQLYVGWMPWI